MEFHENKTMECTNLFKIRRNSFPEGTYEFA
jgi:hypothetical protein